MTPAHLPLALGHPGLDGLEGFDVAGRIAMTEGELAYSKDELIQYWSLQGQGISLSKVISHPHSLDCLVAVRVGQNRFTLLYHGGDPAVSPPSSAMPFVLMLYASGMAPEGSPCVSIFSDVDADYDACSSCLQFLVENVVGNANQWSLSSLARDFSISDIDIATSGYGLLLSDAFRAGKLKYAYLDLFRCIEHRALKHARDTFLAVFLDDPKGASEDINSLVKSEKKLYSAVITANASVISGASSVIDSVKASNAYLAAVINRIDDLPSEPNVKSTHIMYAVRNSIAHAKAGDLMVERFPDYEFALSQIVPYVEILALRFAGIELDAALN